jgi:hypothetical protein
VRPGGILHASALYERWCLVRLISLLTETFGFIPEADWLDRVIEGVCGPLTPFELKFDRKDIKMSARLEIQPVLKNGRRPDFRLSFQQEDADKKQKSSYDVFGRDPEEQKLGIILDAKFGTRWHPEELQQALQDITVMRGYDKAARRVFILQPAARVVKQPTSPLAWGHDCDFGQNCPVNHQQGVVRVSPDLGAWLNLQRLITLELQTSFPAPQQDDEGRWVSESFCVGCGCRHEASDVQHRLTKKNFDYWVLSCQNCEMSTTRTHCFSTCRTTLFKNGMLLTYHRTIADQSGNVACPACGEFFDRDIDRDF